MKRFQGLVELEDWCTYLNGTFIAASPAKAKEAKKWVLLNINDDAITPVDVTEPLQKILEKLNETFGYGNFQRVVQKQQILSQIEFPVSKDPIQVFLWIDKQLDILKLCEGKVDNTSLKQIIDTGFQCTMNPDSVSIENCLTMELRRFSNQVYSDF
jgi:hypothetical protein